MKKCRFADELPRMIPHCLHIMIGVATLVIACESLKRIAHIHKGLRDICEAHKQLEVGKKELLGKK